jgi:hypothetical protein
MTYRKGELSATMIDAPPRLEGSKEQKENIARGPGHFVAIARTGPPQGTPWTSALRGAAFTGALALVRATRL